MPFTHGSPPPSRCRSKQPSRELVSYMPTTHFGDRARGWLPPPRAHHRGASGLGNTSKLSLLFLCQRPAGKWDNGGRMSPSWGQNFLEMFEGNRAQSSYGSS